MAQFFFGSKGSPERQMTNLEDIRRMMLNPKHPAWIGGGNIGGTIRADLCDETVRKIVIGVNQTHGFYLVYSPGGGPYSWAYTDLTRLDETADAFDDYAVSLGFFIPPDDAWMAVEDFYNNNGERSPRVKWCDIPPEKAQL